MRPDGIGQGAGRPCHTGRDAPFIRSSLGSSASVVTINGGQGYGLGRPNTQPSEQSLSEPPGILDRRVSAKDERVALGLSQ
jgi:hypothetical protein